jgi:hypothetical protein
MPSQFSNEKSKWRKGLFEVLEEIDSFGFFG